MGRWWGMGSEALLAAATVVALVLTNTLLPLSLVTRAEAACGSRNDVGTIVSSPLFPGTKLFLQCRPENTGRRFSSPFELTPGLSGGPVLPVAETMAAAHYDSDLNQLVLGSSWEQDVFAQLLQAVWRASGSSESLTSIEFIKSSSRLHEEALRDARVNGVVGEAAPDPSDIYNPFERSFCFADKVLEETGWKPNTGTVCIDIIQSPFRAEFGSNTQSEHSVVVFVVVPGTTIKNSTGEERSPTRQERLRAVEDVGNNLMDAAYLYNTIVANKVQTLPYVELIRLAPFRVAAEDIPLQDRDSQMSQSPVFFSVPDDIPIESTAETVEVARALLRGVSQGYQRLRRKFLSECGADKRHQYASIDHPALTRLLHGVHADAAVPPPPNKPRHQQSSQILLHRSPGRVLQLKDPENRCVRFPLPIIDLAYDESETFAEALKAEEAAQTQNP